MPEEKKTRGRRNKSEKLIEQITGMYASIGTAILPINRVDGTIILMGAKDRATELVRVAELHPKMFAALESMLAISVYSALITGHVGMIYAILANHNKIPKILQPKQQEQEAPITAQFPGMAGLLENIDMNGFLAAMGAMNGTGTGNIQGTE